MVCRVVLSAGLLLSLLSAAPALARPGDLDLSFSGDGQATTAVADNVEVGTVALAPGGALVVAGTVRGAIYHPALVRYASDGSLDTSFSGDGQLVDPRNGMLSALAVQSDGRIVAVGAERESGGALTPAIYRYTSDGAPDLTFSGDGKLTLPLSGAGGAANAVILAPDGSIAIAGLPPARHRCTWATPSWRG